MKRPNIAALGKLLAEGAPTYPKPQHSIWQPMNAAPTDGTRILIKADNGAPWDWAKRNVPVSKRIEIEIGHYRGYDWDYPADDEEPPVKVPPRCDPWRQEGYGSYPIHRPLGWMPLPEVDA